LYISRLVVVCFIKARTDNEEIEEKTVQKIAIKLTPFLVALCSYWTLIPLQVFADLPKSGKFAAAPDEWLLGNGQPWHHQTNTARKTSMLNFRQPKDAEIAVVEKAKQLLEKSSAKAMALFDGDQVIWIGYKWPANSSKRFLSFSVGKTVTAMTVGKAMADSKVKCNTCKPCKVRRCKSLH